MSEESNIQGYERNQKSTDTYTRFLSLIAIMLDYDVRNEKYINPSCIIDRNKFFSYANTNIR